MNRNQEVHGSRCMSRGGVLVVMIALAFLMLPLAAPAADIGGAKQLAVRLKTAELRGNWATVWSLMVQKQRAYIPQGLFVRCMRNRTGPAAKSIAALSVATAKAAIPGSPGAKVSVSIVKVKVGFGKAAPSQTTAVRVVRVGVSWFWITEAASKKDFTRRAFCG